MLSAEDRAKLERWEREAHDAGRQVAEEREKAAAAKSRADGLTAQVEAFRRWWRVRAEWNHGAFDYREEGHRPETYALLLHWFSIASALKERYDSAEYDEAPPWPRAMEETIEAVAALRPMSEANNHGEKLEPWRERLAAQADEEANRRDDDHG